jgi:hypothetical protein
MILEQPPQDVSQSQQFPTSEYRVGQVAAIVDMLANKVYTDKPLAVVRELSCNAHDSQVVAGTTHMPFFVHVPTPIEPWFSIRDYGTGLSDTDLRTIFAGIGISTKLESNEVIGCFGVGNLSPFSIADSFTVTSYFNGQKSVYSCRRDAARKPEVVLLSQTATEEHNGLLVYVNVPRSFDMYCFLEAAIKTFQFWGGTTPEFNHPDVKAEIESRNNEFLLKAKDGKYGVKRFNGSDFFAVMGNIAYKVPYALSQGKLSGYAKFDMGSLEFDVARENLVISEKNNLALQAMFATIREEVKDLIEQEILSQPTPFLRAVQEFNLVRRGSIDTSLWDKKHQLPKCSTTIESWKLSRKGRVEKDADSCSLPIYSDTSKIEYYLYQPKTTARIREYVKNNPNVLLVVLTEEQVSECLIDSNMLKNLMELPKPVRSKSQRRETTGVWSFNMGGSKASDYWSEVSDDGIESLENEQEVVYIDLHRYNPVSKVVYGNGSIATLMYALQNHKLSVRVYGVNSSYKRSEDFNNINWISLEEYLTREIPQLLTNGVYSVNQQRFSFLRAVNHIVTSQEIAEVIDLAKSAIYENDRIIGLADLLNIPYTTKTLDEAVNRVFDEYPMLQILAKQNYLPETCDRKILASYLGG